MTLKLPNLKLKEKDLYNYEKNICLLIPRNRSAGKRY